MTFTDSPDWQEVSVTVPQAGAMPDAPDWQRTVVAPGGTPSGGGGALGSVGARMGPYAFGWKGWTLDHLLYTAFGGTADTTIFLTSFAVSAYVSVSKIHEIIKLSSVGGFTGNGQGGIYEADGFGFNYLPNLTLLAYSDPSTSIDVWNALAVGTQICTLDLNTSVDLDPTKVYYHAHHVGIPSSAGTAYMSTSPPSDPTQSYFNYNISPTTDLPASIAGSSLVGISGPIFAAVS